MASAGKPRLTLVQRQQQLLEERGFSKAKATEGAAKGGRSDSFAARQDAHLQRTGRAGATAASRRREEVFEQEDECSADDGATQASRFSHAPSLHPSMAGTVMSEACSRDTIGAGDSTLYWDFQHRTVTRADLGHNCRECRMAFTTIGDPLTERRGARVSMRYHAECEPRCDAVRFALLTRARLTTPFARRAQAFRALLIRGPSARRLTTSAASPATS